ncbi:HEAT repeat domain-containing protein [Paenibacillus xanthanilyticus]|uniref:HEAT repeat domain-containing protein n=1 Tax=Paenibacillus xanthanilyticus TaxID=1783531 RepID=A0ABV8K5N2_9BACL
MNIQRQLDRLIAENAIDDAIAIIQSIGEMKDSSQLNTLIKHLRLTDNSSLRNEIALALSDIGHNTAVEPIIEVLVHPKTKGNRGTLLYALENLDYISHIVTIAGFIGDDSFEAGIQLLLLLENVIDQLSEEEKERCRKMIEPKWKMKKNEALQDALELLS